MEEVTTRSEQFEQAVDTMVAIARIPSLAHGAVRFEDDLSGGGWYESLDEADAAGGLGPTVELPEFCSATDDPASVRIYCRAALAAALTADVETLPLMIQTSVEMGGRSEELYRRALRVRQDALAPRAEVAELPVT